LGQDKVRTLVVTQLESTIRADLVGQGLSVHRVGRVESSDSAGGYRQTGIVEVPFLRHRGEPLFLEIEHFVQCVISGAEPKVGGEDGVAALELVELVRQAATGAPR
jgi:predicted dehydrogenase